MTDANLELRKNCPMRHENGNCTVCGGFCTAVNNSICEALHNAYSSGFGDAARAKRKEPNDPLTLDELKDMHSEPVWVDRPDGYKYYNGWALVNVSWKAKKQVYVVYNNGASDYVDFLLDEGGKIYRRKPEEGTE